jgi:hypothetical protein
MGVGLTTYTAAQQVLHVRDVRNNMFAGPVVWKARDSGFDFWNGRRNAVYREAFT